MAKWESPLAQFHNQKNFDYNPKNNTQYSPGSKEHINAMSKEEELRFSEKNINKPGAEKHLQGIVALIDGVALSKLYENNSEQMKLLEQKKMQAKKLIMNVLKSIEGYMDTIGNLDNVKLSKDSVSQSNFVAELERIDKVRTIKHDAMISDINIANRFILNNFGKIDEEQIEEWEEKEEEAGRKIVFAKRVDFPKNVICMDGINMEDRKQISSWAMRIHKSLAEIKKGLAE